MSLYTAHKILIASAVACFAFYAVWEIHNFLSTGDSLALVRAAASALGTGGLAVYLRRVWRRGSL
jgi:hypothetical protein